MAAGKGRKKKQKGSVLGFKKDELQEAERLHGLLFGTLGNVADNLGKEVVDFRRDVLGDDLHATPHTHSVRDGLEDEKKPAWVDEAEDEVEVKTDKGVRVISGRNYVAELRAHHTKLNPGTDWAILPSEKKRRRTSDSDSELDEEDEVKDDILRENDDLVVKSKARLSQGLIEVSRVRDANAEEPSNAVVRSVEFHTNGQILMTSGFDKKLRFFQIDGKRNTKVQSVFLDEFPIQKARFTSDGSQVIATARRKVYALYDMVHGKVQMVGPLIGREERSLESFEVSPDSKIVAFMGNEGYILLSSLGTKQLVGTLKMNGSVRSLAFTNDGKQLISCGGDGEVYSWDLTTRRCIHRGKDEGGINNTALCISPNNNYFCTGSASGVVNVYDREEFLRGDSKPIKSLMNLTTTIDNLRFNHDTQILAICSRMKKDALRLVHVPSFTVFANWPTMKTPLQYVHSVSFSPHSGYLAAGNASGKALLYRLRHYDHS